VLLPGCICLQFHTPSHLLQAFRYNNYRLTLLLKKELVCFNKSADEKDTDHPQFCSVVHFLRNVFRPLSYDRKDKGKESATLEQVQRL
jgi:hypothetical protein